MTYDFYSQEGATQHQDVYDLHRQLWWKAVVEALHMCTHREQSPHTPTGEAKGRIHPSDFPMIIATAWCSRAEKVALITSRKAIRRQPEAYPEAHFKTFTFRDAVTPLLRTSVRTLLIMGPLCKACEMLPGCSMTTGHPKLSQHIQYTSTRQISWGFFYTTLKELKKNQSPHFHSVNYIGLC